MEQPQQQRQTHIIQKVLKEQQQQQNAKNSDSPRKMISTGESDYRVVVSHHTHYSLGFLNNRPKGPCPKKYAEIVLLPRRTPTTIVANIRTLGSRINIIGYIEANVPYGDMSSTFHNSYEQRMMIAKRLSHRTEQPNDRWRNCKRNKETKNKKTD